MKRLTFETAAIEVMREQGETRIWLGSVNLWNEVYARRYGSEGGQAVRAHPMNRAQAVFDAIRRSKRFRHMGYIRSVGWSDRESRHPVFELVEVQP